MFLGQSDHLRFMFGRNALPSYDSQSQQYPLKGSHSGQRQTWPVTAAQMWQFKFRLKGKLTEKQKNRETGWFSLARSIYLCMIRKDEQSDKSLSHYCTCNVHTERNVIKIGEFYRMWKEEVLDVLSDISDYPRGTDINARNNNQTIVSPRSHQIRLRYWSNLPYDLCVQKLWKPIPFAIEYKFTVPVNTSQKNFTKSLNVRRRADKWFRIVFGAAVDRKIQRKWI